MIRNRSALMDELRQKRPRDDGPEAEAGAGGGAMQFVEDEAEAGS